MRRPHMEPLSVEEIAHELLALTGYLIAEGRGPDKEDMRLVRTLAGHLVREKRVETELVFFANKMLDNLSNWREV